MASLKRPNSRRSSKASLAFPWSKDHGLIEAVTHRTFTRVVVKFPWSKDHGLIEAALFMLPPFLIPDFHGRKIMATVWLPRLLMKSA